MKRLIKEWLGLRNALNSAEARIEVLEKLLLHRESYLNGFGTLKKHLQRPDKPLPNFGGKPIEQD